MVRSCIVCGNKQGINPHLSFHKFPREEKLRKLWLQACHLNESEIKDRTILCSAHFVLDDDFDELYWPRRKLKIDAVPSPSINHFRKHSAVIIHPQNTVNCNNTDQTIDNNNNESNERTRNIENCKNTDDIAHEKNDILRVENLEIPEEDSYIVIIENSVPSPVVGNAQSPDLPPLGTANVKAPRYFGDLKAEHFSTPDKAEKNLAFINRLFEQNRKKVRQLNRENRRLKYHLANYDALLADLRQNKLVSDETVKKFNIRRFCKTSIQKQSTELDEAEVEENEVFVED